MRARLLAVLFVGACGGGGGGSPPAAPPSPPPPVSHAPVIQVATARTAAEGQPVEIDFTMTDADGFVQVAPLGGADAAYFSVASSGSSGTLHGTLSLRMPDNMASDYEWPFDADRDNVYSVLLRASDGVNVEHQEVRVTITNVAETPVVTRLATGFDEPVALSSSFNNDFIGASHTVLAERKGRIYHLRENGAASTRQLMIDLGPEISSSGEMGLLNVLIYSEGANWGSRYAPSELFVLLTNLQGDTELRRYLILADWTGVERPTSDSDFLILRATMPGGATGNPGGLLTLVNNRVVVGIGDGGGTGDPAGLAQNPTSMRGKILKLLPNGDGYPGDPDRNFMIPSDAPNVAGVPREVVAMGVRNPVRGSYDFKGQAILFVDAGEHAIEEVDRLPNGLSSALNFGWPAREGLQSYNGGANNSSFIAPIAEYAPNSASTSRRMNGGLAFHGPVEAMQAEFFFGDPLTGQILSFPFRNSDTGPPVTTFFNRTTALAPDIGHIDAPVAIVADYYTDMLILDADGEIFRYHKSGS